MVHEHQHTEVGRAGHQPGAQYLGDRDRARDRAQHVVFAENVATFSIVMGFALLLAGTGFLVLTLRLPWRGEEKETASEAPGAKPALAS
jgi:hypothetical protein